MPSTRLLRATTAIIALLLIPFVAIYLRQPPMSAPAGSQIIVVGAGLAGLAAAHAALTTNPAATVLVLERGPKPGGNSIKASSGISAAPTRFQPAAAADSAARFRDDTVRSAGLRLAQADEKSAATLDRRAREALIDTLTDRSAAAVEFLHDGIGVDLSLVAQLGGHSAPRTHRGAGKAPPGFAIISALLAKLKDDIGKDGRFELKTYCEVSRLLTKADGGVKTVVGVEYTHTPQGGPPTTVEAHGPVIFATGGFAGDATGLLIKYRPDLGPLPSTNDARPATAHDILERDVSALLVDMDSVQVHPTGFVDPATPNAPVKILAAELLRGEGGILLRNGKRFVNEMDTRERVSAAIMAEPPVSEGSAGEPRQWDIELLLDPGACEASANHLGFYMFKGLMTKKKISELDETIRQTLREYSEIAAGKKADAFGRRNFGHWTLSDEARGEEEISIGRVTPTAYFTDPTMGGAAINSKAQVLSTVVAAEASNSGSDDRPNDERDVCVGRVTPITHFTMGGAAMDDSARVLSKGSFAPVPGLWAAGEITGGVHGDNRLGGSSLLECVVFGRVAGEEAAKYLLPQ